ncbi:phospholipase D-like domain-containing protein [Rufibacter immobilis]|uniref:phospholipase D-like domain-containing protein n=1 Tax=Rufibacter immobilis TaxID=1348778 RepID=UPI0035ED8C31
MDVTVHFSNIKEVIISNLRIASKEIKVAVAWLTDEDIIRVLTQRQEAGINIKIAISDSKENFKSTNKFKDYLRLQGQLFISIQPFLHHKFCVIDEDVIINGSYNWSYPARSNEENILIIKLEEGKKEDMDLLKRFNVKHSYICNRCSVNISDYNDLNRFISSSKDNALALSELDEHEIILREAFENDVRSSFDKAIALKIPISQLMLNRMKADGGGVEFVKRIIRDEIASGDMKSGFKKLEEQIPHRVDLSLEYLVSRPKYKSLFTKDEIVFCERLMVKYGL